MRLSGILIHSCKACSHRGKEKFICYNKIHCYIGCPNTNDIQTQLFPTPFLLQNIYQDCWTEMWRHTLLSVGSFVIQHSSEPIKLSIIVHNITEAASSLHTFQFLLLTNLHPDDQKPVRRFCRYSFSTEHLSGDKHSCQSVCRCSSTHVTLGLVRYSVEAYPSSAQSHRVLIPLTPYWAY
jgi:hypothetical protein